MRLAFLIAVALTAASPALAADRYGASQAPQRKAPAPAAAAAMKGVPAGYAGPMLGWSRKVQPNPQAARAAAMPRRLPNGLYAGPTAPPMQAPRRVLAAPPQGPQQPLGVAPKAAPQTTPQGAVPLPDSLYSKPTANTYASASPRFYSVYREYGGQPDALPARTEGATWAHRPEASLIDPLDPPKKKKNGDDEDRMASEMDGDWGAGLMGGAD